MSLSISYILMHASVAHVIVNNTPYSISVKAQPVYNQRVICHMHLTALLSLYLRCSCVVWCMRQSRHSSVCSSWVVFWHYSITLLTLLDHLLTVQRYLSTVCCQFLPVYPHFSGLLASISGLGLQVLHREPHSWPTWQRHHLQMVADTGSCLDPSLTSSFDIKSFHLMSRIL